MHGFVLWPGASCLGSDPNSATAWLSDLGTVISEQKKDSTFCKMGVIVISAPHETVVLVVPGLVSVALPQLDDKHFESGDHFSSSAQGLAQGSPSTWGCGTG